MIYLFINFGFPMLRITWHRPPLIRQSETPRTLRHTLTETAWNNCGTLCPSASWWPQFPWVFLWTTSRLFKPKLTLSCSLLHPVVALLAYKATATAEFDKLWAAPALFAFFHSCGRIKELLPTNLPWLLVAAHADVISAFPIRTLTSWIRLAVDVDQMRRRRKNIVY